MDKIIEQIKQLEDAANLKEIIDVANEKIKEIKAKEHQELIDKIKGFLQETNLLDKPIYTQSDIRELTGASNILIKKVAIELEPDGENI